MKQHLRIALFLITLAACSPGKKMSDNNIYRVNAIAFDKQGHRGCRGLLPENTIPAMLHALDLGVTTLEMDIVFTQDSIAILSHEPFFNHEITTTPDGNFIKEGEERNYNLFNMSFAQTQQYDVGLKPHPRFAAQRKIAVQKPSLLQVFDAVKDHVKKTNRPFPYFNIETKTMPGTDNSYHPAPAVFVDLLMTTIQQQHMEQWVMIQSFDVRTLQYLHKNYPSVPTVLLIEDFDKRPFQTQLQQLGFIPTVYSPHYTLVTKELLQNCHGQNIRVIPWTVNEKNKIAALKAMGVDGIITDYPNLFD